MKRRTMTVGELVATLSTLHPDALVYVGTADPYGDRWDHSPLAHVYGLRVGPLGGEVETLSHASPAVRLDPSGD